MSARVFSIANMKGGVGKTTIAVGLAQQFARKSHGRVLLVDLDAQANASFWACGDATLTTLIEDGKTIDAFLEDAIVFEKKVHLKDYICRAPGGETLPNLDVIASSPALRIVEREITVFLSRRRRNLLEIERVVAELFEAQLSELREIYDVVVFDSAPGISAMTEAALRSSEVIVVPTVPDFISNLGLEAFCKTVCWSYKNGTEGIRRPWVIANMVKTSPHHQMMIREMRAVAESDGGGFRMFQVEIPQAAWIEEAAMVASGGGQKFSLEDPELFPAFAEEIMRVASEGGVDPKH